MVPTVPLITCKICFCIKMTEFTAVFVGEGDGNVDIKEECVEEKDPLSTTALSTICKRGTEQLMLNDAIEI